jgi:hypothetical protein
LVNELRQERKCFACGEHGHYKSDCPKNTKENIDETRQAVQATTLMTYANKMSNNPINPRWILCDSESTVDVIKNKNMLVNIRHIDNPIEITGIQRGLIRIHQVGDLVAYGTVYYHPEVSANILSFDHIALRFKSVTYDNRKKDAFVVQRDDGSYIEFIPSKDGLYHYHYSLSIQHSKDIAEGVKQHNTMLINTVEGLKRNFNKREIEQAENA